MASLVVSVIDAVRPEHGRRHTRFTIDVSVSLQYDADSITTSSHHHKKKEWTLYRKYYEFNRLYRALVHLGFPCPRIPLRTMWLSDTAAAMMVVRRGNGGAGADRELLQRRVVSLDMWLQATLSTWRDHFLVADAEELQDQVTRNICIFLSNDANDYVAPCGGGGVGDLHHRMLSGSSSYNNASSTKRRSIGNAFRSLAQLLFRRKSTTAPTPTPTSAASTKQQQRNKKKKKKKSLFSSSSLDTSTHRRHKQHYPDLVGGIHQEEELSLVSLAPTASQPVSRTASFAPPLPPPAPPPPPPTLTPPHGASSSTGGGGASSCRLLQFQRVVVLKDDDGDELTWVFDKLSTTTTPPAPPAVDSDSEDGGGEVDDNFVRNVLACVEEHDAGTVTITLDLVARGVDLLENGFDMVSVPCTPRSRAQFQLPWREFTDKLVNHAEQRLRRTQHSAAYWHHQSDSSSLSPAHQQLQQQAQLADSGSEEGGSECGRTTTTNGAAVTASEDAVRSRLRALYRFAMQQQDEADERNSEGWLSEAASEACGGGLLMADDSIHVVGQFDNGGMVWIAPKSAPPSAVGAASTAAVVGPLSHVDDVDEGEEGDDESEEEEGDKEDVMRGASDNTSSSSEGEEEDSEEDMWDDEDEDSWDEEEVEEAAPSVALDVTTTTAPKHQQQQHEEEEEEEEMPAFVY